MKTTLNFINWTGLCLLFALFSADLNGQQINDYQSKINAVLPNLDTSGVGKGLLLNLSLFPSNELEYYRGMQAYPKQHEMNPEAWESLYRRLSACQISANKDIRFPAFKNTSPDSITRSNIIEIGIIDLEGTWFTEQQSAIQSSFNNRGQKADSSNDEKVRFIAASLLRDDIFQADVRFKISPSLFITNQGRRATALELDFGEGRGYQQFNLEEKLIEYRFGNTGKHTIRIKLHTSGGVFCFRNTIEIMQIERKTPFREFNVSALPIVKDTTIYNTPDGRQLASIPGAKVRVVLGCDQVYNKPVIIVEGLDMGENVNLDRLEATWTGRSIAVMEHYLAEGYDLVLVDWQNSKDYIQNNAQVLKDIIEDVNQTKIGNNPLIVIGTSMGGLVARWALREMEVQSTPHNVSLLICYDTPHQGANIPIGLTQLYWETPLDVFENLVKNALPKNLYEMYMALPSPSPRQLLMHWGGQTNVGVGNKHPDFVTFRNALNALGNGGYPATCRNVAMINGSMDASDQSLFTNFDYGDRIMAGWIPGFMRNTMFDIRTNSINASTYVTRLAIFQVPPKLPTFLLKNIPLNISTNDDFVPGGQQSVQNRVFPWLSTATFWFSFIPTYSSIDYQGPTNTQQERLELNVVTVNAITGPARQTPFAAVYGNQNNINSVHPNPMPLPWLQLGIQEGLLTASGCGDAPLPPVPNIYVSGTTCHPFTDYRERHPFDLTVNVTPVGPSYRQTLRLEKLGTDIFEEGYVLDGADSYTFQIYEMGQYQVTCTRSYPARPDLRSTATAVVNVTNCPQLPVYGDIEGIALPDCKGFWEGDFLMTVPNDPNQLIFAHYSGDGVLYASVGNDDSGAFVPRSTLVTNGMLDLFTGCFAEVDPRVPLPVELLKFEAKQENGRARLCWTTASEIDSERFEIERSFTGHNWQKIANISAHNAGALTTIYEYADSTHCIGNVYYRLKIVDHDGRFTYSRIAFIELGGGGFIVYPNPIDKGNDLRLALADQKVAGIKVFDMTGRLMYEEVRSADRFSFDRLTPGRYIVKVQLANGQAISHPIIKK